MPEVSASVDAVSWVGWLAGASPLVQVVALLMAGATLLAMIWRAPYVADAVARIRGKGETERERQLASEVASLTARLAEVELTLRHVIDHYEEWDRVLGDMLPGKDDCMVPGCSMAQAVIRIAQVRSNRTPLPPIVQGA
ncbi:hypothetical protein UFOVP452_15 [uncultured Caudovirales phage]|uniref:Uncharacterized protein n=1 Tax=uncultured Caudovirales phage TaxID=2100421 RepID=A0A6J5MBU9_9CAUD|nr:hypothetical protein UFOVP452_15 [uncultured Caudovirales phage]